MILRIHRMVLMIFTLYLVQGTLPATAQPYFSRSYDIEPDVYQEDLEDQVLYSSVSKEEGTYYLQIISVAKGNRAYYGLAVSFLQNNEEMAWQRMLTVDEGIVLNNEFGRHSMAETEEGVVVVGNLFTEEHKYSVLFLNAMGDSVNLFTYEHPYYATASTITQGANGNYYIVGVKRIKDDGSNSSLGVFLQIIDEQGNELFLENYDMREYSDEPPLYHQKVLALPDGDILIGCVVGFSSQSAMWYMRLDAEGNLKWMYPVYDKHSKYDSNSGNHDIVYDEKRDRIYGVCYSLISGFPNEGRYVFALDGDGNLLWDVEFKGYMGVAISGITLTKDGDIIVCGNDTESEEEYEDPLDLGWIAKIDKNGNKIWERHLQETSNRALEYGIYNFMSVDIVGDENLLLGGNIVDTVGGGHFNVNAWIVRLDSLGRCSGDECPEIIEIDHTTTSLNLAQDYEFKMFPNPVSDYVTIQSEQAFKGRIEIFDMEGRLMKKQSINKVNEVRINCSDLSPGNYIVHLRSDKGFLYGHRKIVIF